MSYDINYNKWKNLADLIKNGGSANMDEKYFIKTIKRKLMRDKEYHMEEWNDKKNSIDVFGAGIAAGRLNQIDDIMRFIEDIEDEQ